MGINDGCCLLLLSDGTNIQRFMGGYILVVKRCQRLGILDDNPSVLL